MIGLVVVSHSRTLATSAADLAKAMVPAESPLRIVPAGGVDDGSLGTDATAVAAAIDHADDGDGVVVLCDLGSALLSADMARDFIPPELAARTVVSAAPLVEGLVAAAVAANAGAPLQKVEAEARRGLVPKQAHVGDVVDQPEGAPVDAPPPSAERTLEFTMSDPDGLHLRPAADVVAALAGIDATVLVSRGDDESVEADSALSLMTLGISHGDVVRVRITGPETAEAIAAVEQWRDGLATL